jgi:hypothetical protein
MRVEFVDVVPQEPKVPVLLGHVYRYKETGIVYLLSRCRTGGYQLSVPGHGTVLEEGPFNTSEGVMRYLSDGRWEHLPGAVLHVPKA